MIFCKGQPGSGKSYWLVTHILANPKSIFTNIPFEYYPKRVKALDNDTFKADIQRMYLECQKMKNVVEHKLYFARQGYKDVDFYLDEVHVLGFDKKDPAVLFFMSVTRHIGCNIVMATQTLEQIEKTYVKMSDQWISAVPPTQRKHKAVFEYLHHQSPSMNDLKVYKTQRVKGDPKTFWWYDSGNPDFGDNSLRNILRKFQIFFAFLAIVIALAIWNFVTSDSLGVKTTEVNETVGGIYPDMRHDINESSSIDDNKSSSLSVRNSFSIICDTTTGCFHDGSRVSFLEFIKYVVPSYSKHKQVTLLKGNNSYRIVKFTLYTDK